MILFFTFKTFVPITEVNAKFAAKAKRNRKAARVFMFLSRVLMILALVAAFAAPKLELTRTLKGDPTLTIAVDSSSSMDVFDLSFVDELSSQLNTRLPTTVIDIGTNSKARQGSDLLANLRNNRNILLITDGHTPRGASFTDVVSFATAMNATLNAIDISAVKEESLIAIEGPSKVVADLESPFTVKVSHSIARSVAVRISVDGEIIYDEETSRVEIPVTRSFSEG
ncbi:MAG: hypothetical protein ABIH34_04170, partial [Nanoarchaeota archaeon]